MAIIVGIKFRSTNKIYYFDPAGEQMHKGDYVKATVSLLKPRADLNMQRSLSQTRTWTKAKSFNL